MDVSLHWNNVKHYILIKVFKPSLLLSFHSCRKIDSSSVGDLGIDVG